ncbi:hypothetical protein [Novosphingobium colocasiae]|uniref:Uncharacterized protein n=1 Tax=Novosphingobium colocasiae TaxID=1256513 RepID=A0A918PIA8_9SPHN|nr:hypothetical protein [Novosphingobium colocasiae]GGZ07983.1 hypothetical protein GCM10011614_23670 [Novosphingobium colocasiae]
MPNPPAPFPRSRPLRAGALCLAAAFSLSGLGDSSAAAGKEPPPVVAPAIAGYPAYMPMHGLRAPAVKLFVKCDASRAAGREVYQGRSGDSLYGRAEGGFEFVYEARDGAGNPCVYPFAPWLPQIVGSLDGTQYILRSSQPGHGVIFRTADEWASVDLRLFEIGRQRIHFEMQDISLDFSGAIQPKGGLQLEAYGGEKPGLFTAVVRRARIYGGKNAIFVPGGQTMLYVEDSDIAGNLSGTPDQDHTTYINGILVSHLRNSLWRGQRGWSNVASGHQLKDKAYLRIWENVTVANQPNGAPPSAMPLIDALGYGFTWSNGLKLARLKPEQAPRDALVDLRTENTYSPPQSYPWSVVADPAWRMPANPLAALDKVYLSVFLDTTVQSFRTEPYVFAVRPQGTRITPGTTLIEGNEQTTRAQQRIVSLAFNTVGNAARIYSDEGWGLTDPEVPQDQRWIFDRDAFARHALGLIGR